VRHATDPFFRSNQIEIAKEHPEYGFDGHKGYGTKSHMAAIHKHGPSPYHRKTFAPVKYMPGGSAYDGAS
jgi:ribonuclease HII